MAGENSLILFCSPDNFQVSDILWKWLASCVLVVYLKNPTTRLFIMLVLHMMMNILKHTNHVGRSKVMCIQAFCYRFRHPATDSGILLQIQASCYRFRHLATDSGILLQVQAFCYRFRHLVTDSGILLQIQAFCYRFRHLDTDSGILLHIQAICYRVMQFN